MHLRRQQHRDVPLCTSQYVDAAARLYALKSCNRPAKAFEAITLNTSFKKSYNALREMVDKVSVKVGGRWEEKGGWKREEEG